MLTSNQWLGCMNGIFTANGLQIPQSFTKPSKYISTTEYILTKISDFINNTQSPLKISCDNTLETYPWGILGIHDSVPLPLYCTEWLPLIRSKNLCCHAVLLATIERLKHNKYTWLGWFFFHCAYITSTQWIYVINIPMVFRVTSLALGHCPSASEVNLKTMGKTSLYWTKTKHNNTF